jgi:hypothetical protein
MGFLERTHAGVGRSRIQVSPDAEKSRHLVFLSGGHQCASGTATAALRVCHPDEIKRELFRRVGTKGVGSLYASALPKHNAEAAIVATYRSRPRAHVSLAPYVHVVFCAPSR